MRLWDFSRYVLSSCAAIALLSGCGGGSQPLIYAPGATGAGTAGALHASRGGSWMLPDAKGKNLLYAVSDDVVDVYTYPDGKLIGSLGWFNAVVGICVNKAGDVFIPVFGDYRIYEYPHGGTTQKAALKTPVTVVACAVDPKTGRRPGVIRGFGHVSIRPKSSL